MLVCVVAIFSVKV